MDHIDENSNLVNDIFEAYLAKTTPESISKANSEKLKRLEERSNQSEASKRIEEVRRRLHRNK